MRWDLEGSKSPGIRKTGFGWKFWDADPPERWVTLGEIFAIPPGAIPEGRFHFSCPLALAHITVMVGGRDQRHPRRRSHTSLCSIVWIPCPSSLSLQSAFRGSNKMHLCVLGSPPSDPMERGRARQRTSWSNSRMCNSSCTIRTRARPPITYHCPDLALRSACLRTNAQG